MAGEQHVNARHVLQAGDIVDCPRCLAATVLLIEPADIAGPFPCRGCGADIGELIRLRASGEVRSLSSLGLAWPDAAHRATD